MPSATVQVESVMVCEVTPTVMDREVFSGDNTALQNVKHAALGMKAGPETNKALRCTLPIRVAL